MRNKKLKQTYTFDASEGAVKTIAFKGETLMIITDSMVVKSIEPQTLVTKEIRRNPSDVFEMKWSSDDSKLLIVGANRFEVIDAVTLQKSWEQEGIPVPSNTAVNSKGEVIALTEEGVMHYQHDGAFKLDEGTFESGIIGEKYIVLWHKHGMTIYEGNEKIQEIPWQGKEIENVLLIPGKEDIIVQSNDDKAYVINTQTAQIRRQIPLEDNMMGNLIGCHQVAADQSIVIEGEWYTLKVSAVDYKVLWKSDQILDVSDGGKGVLVRDERGGFEDQVVRYPYFDTQRTMDEAKKILNQYWIDEGRKAAYYVE